jgi:hypothetical protein
MVRQSAFFENLLLPLPCLLAVITLLNGTRADCPGVS